MQSTAIVVVACALALAASSCTTAIKGTTQRVVVATIPAGAQCTLTNERAPGPIVVNATPAEVEVRRDSTPLELRCAKEGHLEVTSRFLSSHMQRDAEWQKRQFLLSDVLLRQYQLAESEKSRAREDATAQSNQTVVAATAGATALVTLPVTVLATAAPTLGGGAAVAGAGLVAVPLFLGLVVALPISLAVDLATGAMYSYPVLLLSILPPAVFADGSSRAAYFAEVDRHFAIAGEALQEEIKATCWIGCHLRIQDDEAFVRDWWAQVASAWVRTSISGAATANSDQGKE